MTDLYKRKLNKFFFSKENMNKKLKTWINEKCLWSKDIIALDDNTYQGVTGYMWVTTAKQYLWTYLIPLSYKLQNYLHDKSYNFFFFTI